MNNCGYVIQIMKCWLSVACFVQPRTVTTVKDSSALFILFNSLAIRNKKTLIVITVKMINLCTDNVTGRLLVYCYQTSVIAAYSRYIFITEEKIHSTNGGGWDLTWDPMSWYMELTTLSNRLMSNFWLKSSSCLAGWSANIVISAGIELLRGEEEKWLHLNQRGYWNFIIFICMCI